MVRNNKERTIVLSSHRESDHPDKEKRS